MMQSRLFTLEEASQLISWLEDKLRELDPYRAEIEQCQARVADLIVKTHNNGHGGLEEELHRQESMAKELQKSIEDVIEQITSRGILVRDIDRGLVDFPSERQGRTVHLCWIRGEQAIAYWHETDTGFAGRQPL